MFERLQKKWGLSGKRFFWVMIVFAFTGTTAAWLTAEITGWLNIEKFSIGYWALKIGMLLIGYQILLLFYGFIFGQFSFFWQYERKLLSRMRILPPIQEPHRLIIFASGFGSNAKKIIEYFQQPEHAKNGRVSLVVTNRPNPGIIQIAENAGIPLMTITDKELNDPAFHKKWKKKGDWIILAGFLRKIPEALIHDFPRRIINIHPALLPNFGGKGMYGMRVHDAVIKSGSTTSGITIHFVDEHYDHGETIFQATCNVSADETPESLAAKVHQLEHRHFAEEIEKQILNTSLKGKK